MPRRKRQRGKGPVLDFLKKAHRFVKEKRLISRGLTGLAKLGTPYSSGFNTASTIASTLGYGKKRSHSRKVGRPRKHTRKRSRSMK